MPRSKRGVDEPTAESAVPDVPGGPAGAEVDVPDGDERMNVLGATVREIRRRKSLTLVELAKASGLSIALLSKLENGLGNPSLNTLARLTEALDVPIGAIFERQAPSGFRKIKLQEQIEVTIPLSGAKHRLLVPGISRPFLVSVMELVTGPRTQTPHHHPGVEFISVLTGRVELQIEEESYLLDQGDSATFDPTRLHTISRVGRGRVTLLSATTPGMLP